MKESEAVILVLDTLDPVLSVPLHTAGEIDDTVVPAVVIEEWNAQRLPTRNGARIFAGPVTDVNGDEVSRELHVHYLASFNIVAKHTDEKSRDDLLSTIRSAFIHYEDEPKAWHADVSDVSVGSASPRVLPFREPDWYQGGLELSFVFVERVTVDAETLATIQQAVAIDESLHTGSDDDDSTRITRNL